jgi:hypothetical protein
MYPHERSLVNKLADMPFAIIGVNSDSDLDKIRGIVKEKNISWRSFWNGPEGTNGPISTRWNVSLWPTVYIIDGEGVIRYKNTQGPAMDKALTTILAEMGHDVDLSEHDDEEEIKKNKVGDDADPTP